MISGGQTLQTNIVFQPAKKDGFDLATAVPWGISILTLAVTVYLAIWNFRSSGRRQSDDRRRDLRLEEFRRIRTPIETALGALKAKRRSLSAYCQSPASEISAIRSNTVDSEKEIATLYVDLSDALQIADQSQQIEGDNWLAQIEPIWDSYNDAMGRFRENATADIDAKIAFDSSVLHLNAIFDSIDKKISSEYTRQISA